MFWGSKKRIKEHLRSQGTSVTGCPVAPSFEEEQVIQLIQNDARPLGDACKLEACVLT